MDLDQIKAAALIYKEMINRKGCHSPKKYFDDEISNYDGRYPHLLWMCEEILSGKVDGEKAHRWIGFVQGVVWDDCRYTIGQLKTHNS